MTFDRTRRGAWLVVTVLIGACGGTDRHGPSDAGPIDTAPAIDAAPPVDTAPPVDAVDAAPDASDAQPGSDAGLFTCGAADAFGTCATGDKCTWITDANDPTTGTFLGHIGCVTDGAVAIGGDCHFDACNDGSTPGSDGSCADGKPAIGEDDCATGSYCLGGRCQAECDPDGGTPTCDTDHACDLFNNVFGTADQSPLAGICEPTCDPLTQAANAPLGVGVSQDACGSLTPAETGSGSAQVGPEVGCYSGGGALFTNFTCADSPFGRGIIDPPQDRDPCTLGDCSEATGGGTASFTNGCAPGFTGGFIDATGSRTVICVAFCAPMDSDRTLPDTSQGSNAALGKLPTDAAAVAGHATCKPFDHANPATGGKGGEAGEDCLYLWQFVLDGTGTVPALPYDVDTLGLCFQDADYDYDPTGGTNVTTPLPSCQTLQPGDPCATACPGGQTCIAGGCRIDDVACTGSDDVADTDCYAVAHQCYSAVRTGIAAPFAPTTSAPSLRRHAALEAKLRWSPGARDTAKFRRAGGIH